MEEGRVRRDEESERCNEGRDEGRDEERN